LDNKACGLPDLADLPRRSDRRTGAALLTKYFFKTSPRSLERWPLSWWMLNGRAHCETAELFEVAERMLAQAPCIRGGQRTVTTDRPPSYNPMPSQNSGRQPPADNASRPVLRPRTRSRGASANEPETVA
jgi:hypothetical protein